MEGKDEITKSLMNESRMIYPEDFDVVDLPISELHNNSGFTRGFEYIAYGIIKV